MIGRRVLSIVAFAAAVLWPFALRDWSARWQLTFSGLSLELIGLALVAVDFWFPVVSESSSRLGHRARQKSNAALERARSAALRRLRKPKEVTGTAKLEMAVEVNSAGKVTSAGGRQPTPSQLVRELPAIVGRLNELEARQASEVTELRGRLDAITDAVEEMIRRSKDQYLGLRIVGLALACAGAAMLAAANLVD